MFKRRYTRFWVFTGFAVLLLWLVVPNAYQVNADNFEKTEIRISSDANLKTTDEADDTEFKKYDKPSYFSIFKFITEFIPTKHKTLF